MKIIRLLLLALLATATINPQPTTTFAQGTAFTYQGRLDVNGARANGSYDFRFRLAADELANNYLGTPVLTNGLAVDNGYFMAAIDFGPGVFTGSNYWLEVSVRTNGASAYTVLAPLQPVTATPYAVMAGSASNLLGTLPAAQLSGILPVGQLSGPPPSATNFIGALSGDVIGSQNATVVAGVGGSSAANVHAAELTANAATSANMVGALVKRDASGSFTNSTITLTGNLNLPATTPNAGAIYSGGNRIIHAYGTNSFYAGVGAGNSLSNGNSNVGIGYAALGNNTNGYGNVGIGALALLSGSGANNTAVGYYSGLGGMNNTAIGYGSGNSGTNNIALGYYAGYHITNNGNIDIGNVGLGVDNGIIRLGTPGTHSAAYIAGTIYGDGGGLTNVNAANLIGSAPNLALSGGLYLPATTGAGVGAIYSGSNLLMHTYGSQNFFAGTFAGNLSMSGSANTAIGYQAMRTNGAGAYNAAFGYTALANNTSGSYNTALGPQAMAFNTNGSGNVSVGYESMFANRNGNNNTAVGNSALWNSLSGSNNVANGYRALYWNDSGHDNTANGYNALYWNGSGSFNTADGQQALATVSVGTNNTGLGYMAGYSIQGNNNIDIGNQGSGSDSGIIRIGTSGTHTTMYLAGSVQAATNWYMNDKDLQVRGDVNHGVGWYGVGKTFAGAAVDGPVLYGYSGGALGSVHSGSATNLALYWNASGNVGIGTTSPGYPLTMAGGAYCTGSQWQNASDRNLKENFQPADAREILEKVAALPVMTWNYRDESASVKHLGPTAQDFKAAFNLGNNDRSIGTVDEGGVALAAIQGLNEKLEKTRAENAELKQEIQELRQLLLHLNAKGARE